MAFEDAVRFTLRPDIEGGYVNDPRDPGGETKFGISKRAYPDLDIANLQLKDAEMIYRTDYWDPIHGDELPLEVGIAVFDTAVNMGIRAAIVCLQLALRVVADGKIGANTLAAIKKADAYELHLAFNVQRIKRYTSFTNFGVYGNGWIARTLKLVDYVANITEKA